MKSFAAPRITFDGHLAGMGSSPRVAIVSENRQAGLTSFDNALGRRCAATKRTMSRVFLFTLGVVLAGYALVGRGFAYLGVPPIFVGELTLFLGLLALSTTRSTARVFREPASWSLVVLMLWCSLRTIPYVGRFGVDALRDAALWGYGVFAFVVASAMLTGTEKLSPALRGYERFVPIFLWLAPLLWVLGEYRLVAARVPGTDIPLIEPKPGDLLVHLSGVIAFGLLGVGRLGAVSWVLVLVTFALTAPENRAGMVTVLAVLMFIAILRPLSRRFWRVVFAGATAVTLFLVLDPTIPLGRRELSRDQLIANVQSIFADDPSYENLQATRLWRLAWWATIVDYTVLGSRFWDGKGFGINLADDDGFQVRQEGPALRSPHNGHLTFLARAGVPGFLLWGLCQLIWTFSILRGARHARRQHDPRWEAFFLFLLAYWVAFMTNASFDVFLEGPMGGIWFWSLFGTGIAALQVFSTKDLLLVTNGPRVGR